MRHRGLFIAPLTAEQASSMESLQNALKTVDWKAIGPRSLTRDGLDSKYIIHFNNRKRKKRKNKR